MCFELNLKVLFFQCIYYVLQNLGYSWKLAFNYFLFFRYCTEILGSLPFTLADEPLYLVYAINRMVQIRAGTIEANIKALICEGPLGAVAKKALETIAVQREQENENAYNLDTVKAQKTEEFVDDTDGIPEAAVSKLRVIC